MTELRELNIADGVSGALAGVDSVASALEVIDYHHHEIHEEDVYTAEVHDAAAASVSLSFLTPSGTKASVPADAIQSPLHEELLGESESIRELARFVHSNTAWLLFGLVLLHIGGALKHLMFHADDTIARMIWPGKPKSGAQ